MEKWFKHVALMTVLLVPLAACGDNGDITGGAEAAQVSLLLTDAPGDVAAAVVTVTQIYLQGEGEDSERIVLYGDDAGEGPLTVNLLDLANDVLPLVEQEAVPEGTYGQLRLIVPAAFVVVETETGVDVFAGGDLDPTAADVRALLPEYLNARLADADINVDAGTLQMPSLAQTGLKAILPGGALSVTGNQNVLLLDFDVSRSFGQRAGRSGMWVLNPVITVERLDLSANVGVEVQLAQGVTLPVINNRQTTLADFSAVLVGPGETEGETVVLADADGNGTFEADFGPVIEFGASTLELRGPTGMEFTTAPAIPLTVNVVSGQKTTTRFTLTPVVGT